MPSVKEHYIIEVNMIKRNNIILLIVVVGLSLTLTIILIKKTNNNKLISNVEEINNNYELVSNLNNELTEKQQTKQTLENQNSDLDNKINNTNAQINSLYSKISKYQK